MRHSKNRKSSYKNMGECICKNMKKDCPIHNPIINSDKKGK